MWTCTSDLEKTSLYFLELKVAYCTSFRKLDPVWPIFLFSKKNICSRTGAPESEKLCWTYQWYLLGVPSPQKWSTRKGFIGKGARLVFRNGTPDWVFWNGTPDRVLRKGSLRVFRKGVPEWFHWSFQENSQKYPGHCTEALRIYPLKKFSKLFKVGVLLHSVLLPDYYDFSSTLDLELEQLPELWKL